MSQTQRRAIQVAFLSVILALGIAARSEAQFTQQGGKLVDGQPPYASQGGSVSITADGNTAIVGAPNEDGNVGAAWIYTRTGGVWTTTPTKLICAGAEGQARIGGSVAISSDGSVAVVGGGRDAGDAGAVWTFEMISGVWTPLPAKLVETPSRTLSNFGTSVALSRNGRTLIVGGPDFNEVARGAAWAYQLQMGTSPHRWGLSGKLDDLTADGSAAQGVAVAISGDASTAIVGGPYEESERGSARVWTNAGGTWSFQKKLGGDFAPGADAGQSVDLSERGDTALIGGELEGPVGAARLYTRTGGTWSTVGVRLVANESLPADYAGTQGMSVSLSADGRIAAVGESHYYSLSDPGKVMLPTNGQVWLYTQACDGSWPSPVKLQGTDPSGAVPDSSGQGVAIALSADGSTLLDGAAADAGYTGATWPFATGDLSPCVQINQPCPAFYFLNQTYQFSTSILCGDLCGPSPTYQWSLTAGPTIAQGNPPFDQPTFSIKTKSGNGGGKNAFVGPYSATLCVKITVGGKVVQKCMNLTIYRPGQQPEPQYQIAALNCMQPHVSLVQARASRQPWAAWRPLSTFPASEIARFEAIARNMLEEAKAARDVAPAQHVTARPKAK